MLSLAIPVSTCFVQIPQPAMTSTPQAADLVLMEVPAEEESWSKTTIKTLKGRHVWLIDDFKDMVRHSMP